MCLQVLAARTVSHSWTLVRPLPSRGLKPIPICLCLSAKADYIFVSFRAGSWTRDLFTISKCSTSELHPQPLTSRFLASALLLILALGFKKKDYYFMCTACFTFMYVCALYVEIQNGKWSYGGYPCELSYGCWGLNPSSPQCKHVFVIV